MKTVMLKNEKKCVINKEMMETVMLKNGEKMHHKQRDDGNCDAKKREKNAS